MITSCQLSSKSEKKKCIPIEQFPGDRNKMRVREYYNKHKDDILWLEKRRERAKQYKEEVRKYKEALENILF